MTAWILLVASSLVASALLIVAMLRFYRRACASAAWPPSAGKLLHAEMLSRPADEGPGDVYKLDVRYAYEVDGVRYESTRIGPYFPEWGSQVDDYEAFLRILREAKPLAVFVNPDDPWDAVLLPGSMFMNPRLLIVLSVLVVTAPIAGIVSIWWNFLRE